MLIIKRGRIVLLLKVLLLNQQTLIFQILGRRSVRTQFLQNDYSIFSIHLSMVPLIGLTGRLTAMMVIARDGRQAAGGTVRPTVSSGPRGFADIRIHDKEALDVVG